MSYKYTASQYSATNYIVTRNKVDDLEKDNKDNHDEDTDDDDDTDKERFYISLQSYIIEGCNGFPEVISNYYIDDDKNNDLHFFASIIYEKIDYVDDNYDPYDYDPGPRYLIYRDELSEEVVNKFLKVIETLSKTFYEDTTHWKHFLPTLTKMKLSEARENQELQNIVKSIEGFIEELSD